MSSAGNDPARKPIRVLLVQDRPADTALMRRELIGTKLDFVSECVEEEHTFRAALADFGPDLILADYRLPHFSGPRAVDIITELGLDIPVMVVSGTITESVARDCLDAGVCDYLFTDQMLRVGAAVNAAVESSQVRSERRAIERRHSTLEKTLSAFARSTPDGMIVATASGEICFWNPAAEAMFGYSQDEIIGQSLKTIMPPRLHGFLEDGLDRIGRRGVTSARTTAQGRGLRKDGREIFLEITPGSWESDGETYVSTLVRDVSDTMENERERSLLGTVVEQSTSMVIVTDTDGTIKYVNAAFEKTTGYSKEEAIGQNPRILQSGRHEPHFYAEMWNELSAGRNWTSEFINRRKDGTEYRQRASVFPILGDKGQVRSFVAVAQDVTKEVELETQLNQARKMEAVGQLTGGIAHDFNNLLSSVLTNAELISMSLPPEMEEEIEGLGDIQTAARRGADLVKRLMAFSRDEHLDLEYIDASDVLKETGTLLASLLPENIELKVGEPPEGSVLKVDRTGLQQVLMNLATNARDAMPRGGRLTIAVKENCNCLVGGAEGCVCLEITDTGSGMDSDTLERAFNPFFTTKPRGEGTGLGLVSVHAIITRHHGTIDVRSTPGVGTTVTVSLPRAVRPEVAESTVRDGEAAPRGATPSGKTILVTEDDPGIRRVMRKVLARAGFQVIEAEDGQEALSVLEEHRGDVALVVTDLIMPEMGGAELYEATAGWEGRPPFLITTGYGPSEMSASVLEAELPMLRKPWDAGALVEAVRSALNDTPDAATSEEQDALVRK